MKKSLTALLLFMMTASVFPTLLNGQADKGMNLLDKGNPTAAEAALRTAIDDPKDGPYAMYGMARLFADERFERRHIDSAFAYIEACDRAYRRMPADLKSKLVKKLNTGMIAEQRKLIVEMAADRAKSTGTIDACNHFLEHFTKPAAKTKRAVVTERNKLVLAAAAESTSFEEAVEKLAPYRVSLATDTPGLLPQADKIIFSAFTRTRGLGAFPEFQALFPENVISKDTLKTVLDAALQRQDAAALEDFTSKYTQSVFHAFAVDSLSARLLAGGAEPELRRFITRYPAHAQTQAMWQRYYASVRQSNPDRLEQFLRDNPQYPFPEQVAADISQMKRDAEKNAFEGFLAQSDPALGFRLLQQYPESAYTGKAANHLAGIILQKEARSGGTRQYIEEFLRRFPAHAQSEALWKHLYAGVREQATDPAQLEQFLRDYPQYPFPKQVGADMEYLNVNREKIEYEAFVQKPSAKAGFEFLQRFPQSNRREAVMQRMADLLQQADSRKTDIERFLQEFPMPSRRQALLKRLYSIVSQNLNLEAIASFERSYPDFADKERLAADKKRAIPAIDDLGPYSESKRELFEDFIRSTAPAQKAMDALRRMINRDFRDGKYAAAAAVVNSFQQEFGDQNKEYNQLRALLSIPTEDLKRSDFAPKINTPRDDYAPILSADGRTLYLCRNIGSEDIFVSQMNEQGNWSLPAPVTEWNTSNLSEAPESISADGNEFYLFRSGKFLISRKTAAGWSAPEELPPPFNQFGWQADLSISSDGKAMLFAARTAAGVVDIHAALMQKNGAWGKPFSLGPIINTYKTDRSPFLHPDGKTLYFSSEGHPGFGGSDIFMAKRQDDTWTNWSEPVNLGPAINTTGNDWGFRVSTDGEFAYYTANINGNGDIVRCELPSPYRPEEVATVSGKMTGTDGKPLDAEIVWEDLRSGEVVQVTRTNPSTGEFFAVLPERGRYGYSVRKPGYFPLAGNVDLRSDLGEIRLDKPMELATIEEMKTRDIALPLNNLFFETAKYDIQPESFPELNRLAELVVNEQWSIEIHGHTDSVGGDASNQTLSENRAKAVRDYLVGKGCNPARIVAKGFGKSKPKASNDTDEGRALNRRVEIRIRS